VKNNLGRLDLPSLRYRIDGVFLDTPEGPAEIGHFVWLGESDRSVADILRERGGSEVHTERDEAKDFLRALLPALAKDVQREAKNAGLSWATVRRAAEDLGVRKIKQGKPGEPATLQTVAVYIGDQIKMIKAGEPEPGSR
jgi:hypothetical protein